MTIQADVLVTDDAVNFLTCLGREMRTWDDYVSIQTANDMWDMPIEAVTFDPERVAKKVLNTRYGRDWYAVDGTDLWRDADAPNPTSEDCIAVDRALEACFHAAKVAYLAGEDAETLDYDAIAAEYAKGAAGV